ncbi:protein TALPID3 [Pelodytes ibericus]
MGEEGSDISLDSGASASDVLIRSTSIHRTGVQSRGAAGSPGHQERSMGDEVHEVTDHTSESLGRQRQVEAAMHGRPPVGCVQNEGNHPRGSSATGQLIGMEQPTLSLNRPIEGARVHDSHNQGNTVHISLKRLREVPAPLSDFAFKKQDAAYIPPALPAKKYPAVKLMDTMADAPIAKTQRDPSPPKVVLAKYSKDRSSVKTKQESSTWKSKDIQISQFSSGQKETLLTALNKRAQSVPITKEVKVKLIEDAAASRQAPDTKQSHREIDCATIAAATAAAIAAAAPAFKAQNDMEAQVSSVSQLLSKLHEADRQLQRLTEQQSKIQSQSPERRYYHERVSELESQLTKLTEQRLQHLEKLQQQQIEMQSHFISSTMKDCSHQHKLAPPCDYVPTVAPRQLPLHQPVTAMLPKTSDKVKVYQTVALHLLMAYGSPNTLLPSSAMELAAETKGPISNGTDQSGKSPLETPAPRRFAPVPISKDVQAPQKTFLEKENMEASCSPGQVNLLQQILNDDQSSSFCRPANREQTPANYRHPGNDSGVVGVKGLDPGQEGPSNPKAFMVDHRYDQSTRSKAFSASSDNSMVGVFALRHEWIRSNTRLMPSGASLPGMNPTCLIVLTPDPITSTRHVSGNAYHSSNSAVQKANEVLHDLGTLKREMNSMMQPLTNPSTTYFPTVQEKTQPILLRAVNPPKSLFEDAERILREVQNNKKVLEDNLEAIVRAKDGVAMYSLVNALTTNSDGAERIRIQKAVDSRITEIRSEIQDELTRKDSRKTMLDHRVQESTQRRKVGSINEMKTVAGRNIKGPGKSASKGTIPSAGASAKTQHKQSEERVTVQRWRKEVFSHTLPKKDERSKVSSEHNESVLMDEDAINNIYGKPHYQGHRTTLKKSPYLRYNSPSPKSKPQRPKVLETVRGVKMKSAKVQTGTSESKTSLIKPKPNVLLAPKEYEPQYVFSPSGNGLHMATPLEGHLIPMAIPLGRTQSGGTAPMPSSVLITQPRPVTVNVSVPPSSPKPRSKTVKPNIAVIEMRTEKPDPPKLTVQVLPCVDIDSIASDSTDLSQRAQSPEVIPSPPIPAQPDIQLPTEVESEEEIVAFPGTSFVQVSDILQGDEEESELAESVLELNGWTETAPARYNGIPFPPPAPPPQTATDILDGIINRKETLENRLVTWVEQEIMAQIISEMNPVRAQAVPDISVSSTENSESGSSDIVEAAGGKGLQLFVDAGVPVDSSLVRKFVDEALAETLAIMLGERESRHAPVPPPSEPIFQVPVEIPRVPTPEITPPVSPLPPAREPSTVKTPDLSPQTSLAEAVSPHEHTEDAVTRSPVGTPNITPVASPPRVATPTPPVSEAIEDQVYSPSLDLPNPWGSTELPLEEENPHSTKEVNFKDAVVMTVAKEEEPESLISGASPVPVMSPVSVSPEPRCPSPASSPSTAASTEGSSLTITLTEAESSDHPISEGEILYSYGQVAAAKVFAEGGLVFTNLSQSLSSTLRDSHDMEYDPPSEGQVMHGNLRGAHRDPVLSLLANLNQNPVAPHAVLYHSEGSGEDNSLGEISEGRRPRLTTAAQQVLVGQSAFMRRPANEGQTQRERPSSPRLCQGIAGLIHGDSENISSGPMSIRDLDSHMVPGLYPRSTSDAHRPTVDNHTLQGPSLPQKVYDPVPTRFIQVAIKSEDEPQQGTQEDLDRTQVEPSVYLGSQFSGTQVETPKKMSLIVPSMNEADQKEDLDTTSLESDSSSADTF